MSPLRSVDAVRSDSAEPDPDPPPQRADDSVDPLVLAPDPIVTALKIANCIWFAVNGQRVR